MYGACLGSIQRSVKNPIFVCLATGTMSGGLFVAWLSQQGAAEDSELRASNALHGKRTHASCMTIYSVISNAVHEGCHPPSIFVLSEGGKFTADFVTTHQPSKLATVAIAASLAGIANDWCAPTAGATLCRYWWQGEMPQA